MRKVKEILRLHFEAQLSERQISKICQVGKGTIRRYLERLRIAGLSWPLPDDLDDATLEKKLFPPPPPASAGERPAPDDQPGRKQVGPRSAESTSEGDETVGCRTEVLGHPAFDENRERRIRPRLEESEGEPLF